MNYTASIVLTILFIVVYLYCDHKNVKKKEKTASESKRLQALEERLTRQDALIGDIAGRIDDLSENVKDIREEVRKAVPLPDLNNLF